MEPNRRKFVPRKQVTLKLRRSILNLNGNSSHNSSGHNSWAADKSVLRKKNRQLASTLNSVRLQNAALCQKLNELNGKILELHAQNAELRQTAAQSQADFHQRLKELLAPVSTSLKHAFSHTLSLSDNISAAMDVVDSQSRRSVEALASRSNASSDESFLLPCRPVAKPMKLWKQKNKPEAQVSPRVNGLEIQKPRIRIARLDMADLDQAQVETRAPADAAAEEDNVPNGDEVNAAENVDEDEEEEEQEVVRRQRPRRVRLPRNLAALEEQTDEESGDEVAPAAAAAADISDQMRARRTTGAENREMVLLVPKLVLERITLTPSRSSSRRSSQDAPGVPSVSATGDSETPRSRESFDEFTRRLCAGIDPCEGPSWLFNDDDDDDDEASAYSRAASAGSSGSRRQEKRWSNVDSERQKHSLKARLSSASKRLSMTDDEASAGDDDNNEVVSPRGEEESGDEEVEDEENSTRRRGGRAAAAIARNSLKEQPINTKLRQGDPSTSSVYDDYVPGMKRKSSLKCSKTKAKKSDEAASKRKKK